MKLTDNMITIISYSYGYNKQCVERKGRVNKISMLSWRKEYTNRPTRYKPKLDD